MIEVIASKQDGVRVSVDGNIKELAYDTLAAINGVYTALDDSVRGVFKAAVTAMVTMEDSPVWKAPNEVEVLQEEGDGA